MPSSESGKDAGDSDGPRLCAWCFKPIGGTPVQRSYDLDMHPIYFHNGEHELYFDLAYFSRDPNNPLRKKHEKMKKAYEDRLLKEAARPGSKAKARAKTT